MLGCTGLKNSGACCVSREVCREKIYELIGHCVERREPLRLIVGLPTGVGKTRLSLQALKHAIDRGLLKPRSLSLVVVPLRVLEEQFYEEAKKVFGRENTITIAYDSDVLNRYLDLVERSRYVASLGCWSSFGQTTWRLKTTIITIV